MVAGGRGVGATPGLRPQGVCTPERGARSPRIIGLPAPRRHSGIPPGCRPPPSAYRGSRDASTPGYHLATLRVGPSRRSWLEVVVLTRCALFPRIGYASGPDYETGKEKVRLHRLQRDGIGDRRFLKQIQNRAKDLQTPRRATVPTKACKMVLKGREVTMSPNGKHGSAL